MSLRYSPAYQVLHWLTALGMFAVLPLAWLMRTAPEGTALSYALYRWHETVGLAILLLTVWRLILRVRVPPPPLPKTVAAWERGLAHFTYALFYAVLILMPLTGLLATYGFGFPPKLFNLIDTPAVVAKNEPLASWVGALHAAGQWLVYALIVLHIAGVVFHLVVTRSGLLRRILPAEAHGTGSEEAVSAGEPSSWSR